MSQNKNKSRTKLKLSAIENIIRRDRIIVPCPSRQTLIHLCEKGDFETAGNKPTSFGWLVFEDSFWKWVDELDGELETV